MKKLFLLSSLLLASCSLKQAENNDYPEDKHTYEDVCDLQIAWKEVFNQAEDEYLVYFYSEECGYCKLIKDEVIDYCQKEIYPMYFVDVLHDEDKVIKKPPAIVEGISSIDELFIFGTPSLMKIKEKVVTNYYAGVQSIREFILDVEEDNFSYLKLNMS